DLEYPGLALGDIALHHSRGLRAHSATSTRRRSLEDDHENTRAPLIGIFGPILVHRRRPMPHNYGRKATEGAQVELTRDRDDLVRRFQLAYSGELGAAIAYVGH